MAERSNQIENQDEYFEEYPDLGPAKKFRVNRMDVSIDAEPDSPPPLVDLDREPFFVLIQPTTMLGLNIDEPNNDANEKMLKDLLI